MPDRSDIPIPPRLKHRPVDAHGLVIPYVNFMDARGVPDFRMTALAAIVRCLNHRLCGICGQELGKIVVFIGGDEAVAARLFSDPGMHVDCARYAAVACPFLASAKGHHNPDRQHEGMTNIHNPLKGTVRPERLAFYTTRKYKAILVAAKPGDTPIPVAKADKPMTVEWF